MIEVEWLGLYFIAVVWTARAYIPGERIQRGNCLQMVTTMFPWCCLDWVVWTDKLSDIFTANLRN